jgi:threonine/homoserine/homoserine lactone efflux protein
MPHLLGFVAVAAVICVTPGPDMALVTRSALRGGRRAALLSAVGVESGLVLWTAASVVGIAALLETSAAAFTAVRLAGAAYLVLLGLRALLSLRRPEPVPSATPGHLRRPGVRRTIDAVSGTVLVALGIRVVGEGALRGPCGGGRLN